MRDFDAFCREAWPQLVGALAQHSGDPWLAEELAQEALVRAGDRWSTISGYDAPVGWCYRVGINLARSRFRRRRLERRALRRQRPEHDGPTPATRVVGDAAVRDALALLTEPQREAVVLRHLLDLDVPATAAVMGRSEQAVRGLTHRGITTLRAQLGGDLLPHQPTTGEEHRDV